MTDEELIASLNRLASAETHDPSRVREQSRLAADRLEQLTAQPVPAVQTREFIDDGWREFCRINKVSMVGWHSTPGDAYRFGLWHAIRGSVSTPETEKQ